MKQKVNVLVAGSGNVTGINVIRALVDESNITVFGCDFDAENPSKQWCQSFQVPRCASPDYPAAILDIIEKYNITHVIASNDHDVRALTELKAKTVGFPFFNGFAPNILSCLDKKETEKLFLDAGVQTPLQVFDRYDYPYVLRKEAMGSNRKFVHIVKSEDDMKVVGGMVHHAQIEKEDKLISLCRKLSKSVGLVGMSCIQCITDGENYNFIEINPRPGSGIDLSIHSGVNMPLLWIKETLGEECLIKAPKWGMQMKRYFSGYYF